MSEGFGWAFVREHLKSHGQVGILGSESLYGSRVVW